MQAQGLCENSVDPEPMMNAFKQMIKFQLQAENERILGIRNNTKYNAKHFFTLTR